MFLRIFVLICFVVAFVVTETTKYYPPDGAPTRITNSTQIEELVDKVMSFYNQQSNDPYFYISVKVLEATEQLVNGWVFRLKLNIGITSCKKGIVCGPDVKTCKLQENAVIKGINAENYFNPRENIDKITFD